MRLVWRRCTTVLAAVVLVAACSSPDPSPPAVAGALCAAPHLEVSGGDVVAPGDEITVTGRFYVDGCADAIYVVDGKQTPNETESAMTGLHVEWLQGDTSTTLATVSADASGKFTVTVTVPTDATAGSGAVRVAPAEDVTVEVRG